MAPLWEHATVVIPPDFGALVNVLDLVSARFGAELLAVMPAANQATLAVPGQPPVQVVWHLLLRVPAGNREPMLALVRGDTPPAVGPAGRDGAGRQTLAMDDRALQAAFARD